MSPRRLGNISMTRVIEQEGALLDVFRVFPDATPENLRANFDWMVPRHFDPKDNMIVIGVQSFLLRTQRFTILIDTCVGNDKPRVRPQFDRKHFPWLDRLGETGVRPEQIDFVMCTHFHVDHVGWNTRLENGRWVPTFPNAKYVFAKTEYDHWIAEQKRDGLARSGDYVSDSVLPIVEAGRAVFVKTDHEIDKGVELYHLPGHTPGQCGVHVKSRGDEMIITGDMMHHMLQVRYPDWSTNFDTDQALARKTRRQFLERYADTPTLVATAHFPSPNVGRIVRHGDGFDFRYVDEN